MEGKYQQADGEQHSNHQVTAGATGRAAHAQGEDSHVHTTGKQGPGAHYGGACVPLQSNIFLSDTHGCRGRYRIWGTKCRHWLQGHWGAPVIQRWIPMVPSACGQRAHKRGTRRAPGPASEYRVALPKAASSRVRLNSFCDWAKATDTANCLSGGKLALKSDKAAATSVDWVQPVATIQFATL